jgi:hypothetical protein
LAAGLIFLGLKRSLSPPYLALALALSLFAELGWHGSRYQPVIGRALFESPPATVQQLQPLAQSLGRTARFIGWGWADLLRRSFPDGRNREAMPGLVYFRARPTWIRFSDYSQEPPQIAEFDF